MEFLYSHARLPGDTYLLQEINSAAKRLFQKLTSLNINNLDISDYNKRYLIQHLRQPHNTLKKFSYILSWSLGTSFELRKNSIFLDYGGGSGLLSLLARELGIGTVLYNDIYDISCRDASILGEVTNNQADFYIHGDIDDVLHFLQEQNMSCSVIASDDVIEHIYDIEGFIKKIPALSSGNLNVFLSSGANMFNPLIRKTLMKMQKKVELYGQAKSWGCKQRDCLRPYREVRREMIRNLAPNLMENEIENLAKRTRGKIEPDIIQVIKTYSETRSLPPEPDHSTNTCDPYTGNWAEHLMDPYKLGDILSRNGFNTTIMSGYYGRPIRPIVRPLAPILNLIIRYSGKLGLKIAPFYSIYAKRVNP